jgi:hypothetical protein
MDFVTRVLLRFDSFMAEANKERSTPQAVAKRIPECSSPVNMRDQRETPDPVSSRPAA